MSLFDRLDEDLRQRGLARPGTLADRLDEDLRRRLPPPLPGMIQQEQVMPEARGGDKSYPIPLASHLPSSLGQIKALESATARNLGGMAAAVPQALRHPVATAVGVPASAVEGAMDLAEIVTPHIGDEHPIYGHETVSKVSRWAREKIASDAPFKEAGQYASAVPDLLSIGGTFGGVTRIKPVEKALVRGGMKVAEKLGKVQRRFFQTIKSGNFNDIQRGGGFEKDILGRHDPDPNLPGLTEEALDSEDLLGFANEGKNFVYRRKDGRVLAAGMVYKDTDGRWHISTLASDSTADDSARAWAAGKIMHRMRSLNPDRKIEADSYSPFSGNVHNRRAVRGEVEVGPVLGVSGLKTKVPLRTAEAGRRLIANLRPAPRLSYMTEWLKLPQRAAKLARRYIDAPYAAPSDYLREIATRLRSAREKDASKWKRLTFRQKKLLAVYGDFRGSPNYEYLADQLGMIGPGRFGRGGVARALGPTVDAPVTRAAKRWADVEAGAKSHRRAAVEDFFQKWVEQPGRRVIDYAFRRPGTKGALASRFIDQPVRRVLTSEISRWVEAGENERRRLTSETDNWLVTILQQLVKDSDGSWETRDKLARKIMEYWRSSGTKMTGQVPSPIPAGRRAPRSPYVVDDYDAQFERYLEALDDEPGLTYEQFVEHENRVGQGTGEEPTGWDDIPEPQPPDYLTPEAGSRTWSDGTPIFEPPPDMNIPPGTTVSPLIQQELDEVNQLLNARSPLPDEGTGMQQARNMLSAEMSTGDPEGIRRAMLTMRRAIDFENARATRQRVRLRITHRGRGPARRTASGGVSAPESMMRGKSPEERAVLYDELEESLPQLDRGADVELSDQMKAVLDDVRIQLQDRYRTAAAQGHLTAKQIAKIQRGDELMLDVYRAAHDPTWVDRARGLDSWAAIHNTFKQANPTWTSSEINGAIKKLLDVEVAKKFEEDGFEALADVRAIRDNPILRHIFSNEEYADMLRADIGHLYGKINDGPTALALAGRMLAETRAQNVMTHGLTQDLSKVGIAVSAPRQLPPREGYVDVSEYLGIGGGARGRNGVWVPRELEDVYKNGAATYRDMHAITRALLKTGARWRVWSTVYSPTATTGQALSNTFSISGSGDLYRPEFGKAIRHSFRQVMSVLRRGGQAELDRPFEVGLSGRGLSAESGAIAGEIGSAAKELGMVPKVGETGEIYSWMRKAGIDPKSEWARTATDKGRRAGQFARDAFHQGDAIFKRTMASLIAADFNQIKLNGTENDIRRIMVGLFGSDDAATVAADMTSNMTQSYQRVSQLTKDLGKSGVLGLFSSFPYESTRNFGWTAAYTVKYLQGAMMAESPVVRKILVERAMRSIAGMSINLRFLSELGDIVQEEIGPKLTEEQREAYRKIAPEYDQGPMAIIGRDKENLSYIPGGNLEYFQAPRRILENLTRLLSSVTSGQWNQVDEDLLRLTTRLSDDFLQFHQPARGLAESLLNRKIEASPVSTAASAFRRRAATRLSTQPIGTQYAKEVLSRGLKPGIAPTPVRQILGLGEWATSPDPEAGISPREVSPFKVRNLNLPKTLGAIGGQLAEEKNNFATQINKINKELISPQEKARKIMALRNDWNNDFGPRVARDLEQLRVIFTRKEIGDAMQQVGRQTIIAGVNGRVPRFDLVFKDSIPGRVKFYMRGR